jgi:hypothetical protein
MPLPTPEQVYVANDGLYCDLCGAEIAVWRFASFDLAAILDAYAAHRITHAEPA